MKFGQIFKKLSIRALSLAQLHPAWCSPSKYRWRYYGVRLLRPAAGPHAVRHVLGRAGDELRMVGAARPVVIIRLFFLGYVALLLALAMSADPVHNSYGLSEAMQAAIRTGSSR
jgi:hypothetical protein